MEKKYLVIDVGGTSTKYAVMDEDCNFLEKGKFPSVQEPLEGFVDSIVSLYRKYEGKVEGIAMSMPGVLDSSHAAITTVYTDCDANGPANVATGIRSARFIQIATQTDRLTSQSANTCPNPYRLRRKQTDLCRNR